MRTLELPDLPPQVVEEINIRLAKRYGVTKTADQSWDDVMPPDFLEGTYHAGKVISLYSRKLQCDKRDNTAVHWIYDAKAERQNLTLFVLERMARTIHKPISEWSIEFRRGVEAEIKYQSDPKRIEADRRQKEAPVRRDWKERHPRMARLGLWHVAKYVL